MPCSGVQVHGHLKGKHCLKLVGQGVMTNKQQGKSKRQAACFLLFGMFFMAALCHIQKDSHCYKNFKSSFLVSPAWEKASSGATRPTHNLCFFFHINNQQSFCGNGIPVS
jgi:hypothetical protein